MIQYKLILHADEGKAPASVRRMDTGLVVPFDVNNSDYQKYLEWIAQGNTPLPAEE